MGFSSLTSRGCKEGPRELSASPTGRPYYNGGNSDEWNEKSLLAGREEKA